MKIAMLGQKRIPFREGGVEVVVEELATRMAAGGHQVTCFDRRKKGEKSKVSHFKGVTVRSVCTLDRRGFAALTSSVNASFLAAFSDYEIVHFHAEGSCVMLWLPHLLGKRCIVTIHGLDHQRAKWGRIARACIRFGEKVAVRFADEIIVLSRSEQRYFLEEYGRKTVFVPNGVTHIERKEARLIREKYHLEKDGYLLFLGRLVPEKGIQYLIEAYLHLRTDKKLVIAGGASDTDAFVRSLKKMAKDDPNIIFTGFVDGELLAELYSNAYVYVLPSELEGMPLSLLEAMSLGNCCVVSDIDECVAVTKDHAVAFRKGDAADLRDKLQELCSHPEIVQKYRETSVDFICQKYRWDDVVEQTLEIYEGKRQA